MEIRSRKQKSENGRSSNKLASRPQKKQNRIGLKPLMIFSFLGILFLGYLAIYSDLKTSKLSSSIDNLATSFNLQKSFYAVIIDAGSTGSRLLAFTFHSSLVNGEMILDDELFLETKPGLSSFADNPKEAVKSLEKLLDQAKALIPKSLWSSTPFSMKATAGLRLLPPKKANAILDECKKFFDNSGFLVTKDSVSIMEGADEGIFGWFTVNFLFNRLSSESKNTVAVLDLGGGSTQVTYAPDEDELKDLQHVYTISALKKNMSLYTHSHLGMGLMAARKAIITIDVNLDDFEGQDVIEVHSECINPMIKTQWSYNGKEYLVNGPVNGSHKIIKTHTFAGTDEDVPVVRFDECVKAVKKHTANITERPVGLRKHNIYPVSYYFDRATGVGLIDPFEGGVITLNEFHEATLKSCGYPNTDQPFLCLDMTYIYVLLQDCFGLDGSTKLNLYKKYKGHELSWALGAAFSILQGDH